MDRVTTIIALLLTLLTGCKESSLPPVNVDMPSATTTISELKRALSSDVLTITEHAVVYGIVTSSDKENNFYKSIMLEQDGSAVEILLDGSSLYTRYPVGCQLAILLKGLSMSKYHGVVQIGIKSEDWEYYPIEEISAQIIIDKHIFRGELHPKPNPKTLEISELDTKDCGLFVRIEGLKFEPLEIVGEENQEHFLSGYCRLVDSLGNSIHSYVSDYARFADKPITPGTTLSIQGTLQYLESGLREGFIIKPSHETDITL